MKTKLKKKPLTTDQYEKLVIDARENHFFIRTYRDMTVFQKLEDQLHTIFLARRSLNYFIEHCIKDSAENPLKISGLSSKSFSHLSIIQSNIMKQLLDNEEGVKDEQ